MMQLNPRAFLRAATTVLRPTTAAVPRAMLTSTARAPRLTRRPLFPPHHRAFSATTTYYHRRVDMDIKELTGAYSYVVDVPGFRASDLTVRLLPDRWIEVRAVRRDEDEADVCRYLRKGRPRGKLHHSFGLLQDADLARVSAVCRDGVLTVTVEKLPPPPEPVVFPRTIEIQS